MIDFTSTALNEWQQYALGKMRATLFTDAITGKTYIHKSYWNGITEQHREALSKIVETFADLKQVPVPKGGGHE